jgi:hypothetical protein
VTRPATPLRALALLALALALTLIAVPATASAKKRSNCATAGTTLAKNKTSRLYQVTVRTGDVKEPRTYGCWLKTGDRIRLDQRCDPRDGSPEGDDACTDDPDNWALTGKYAAITVDSLYDGEGGHTYAYVVKATLGRKPKADEVLRLKNRSDESLEIGPFVERLFISKTGAIAYGASDVTDESVVGVISPGGEDKTVDSGPKLKAKSLAASATTLTWTNDGVAKSAPWS